MYGFGDSLTDVTNSNSAFPDKFQRSEMDPYDVTFPMHAADRYTDGKMFIDFLAFGVRMRPNYAILRSTARDFTYGSNFAASGGSARPVKVWNTGDKFSTPFSLDVQQQWFQSLYDKKLTVSLTWKIVPEVVKAIEEHIEKMLAVVEFTPLGFPTMLMPLAKEILIQNQPPLGCMPAMLTVHGGSHATYDEVDALRQKYPAAKLYYADVYGVYKDMLKKPAQYNVTAPLQASCGAGGKYNFNKDVWCGESGVVEGKFVNLTSTHSADPAGVLSLDDIHTSNMVNKATAFLKGKHIFPEDSLKCSPDFTFWDIMM
uniref:Uncharacterized protein n=1 Tax=Physcomitrium patens TaxID=3218 RepID=A0A2K1IVT8_PHYPA|nr:hypothetical protein PHYPA_025339 [Physcomitrium patens]